MGLDPGQSLVDYSASLKKTPEPPRVDQRDEVEVFDNATGGTSWVPPEEAQQRFVSGEINLPSGREIPVEMPDGEIGTVAAPDVSKAIADGGRLITDRQEHAEALRKEYSGGKGMAIAGAAGVGRGLTFGASDEAAQLFAGPAGEDAVREAIEASNEYHPIAQTVGEVGGMALGSALVPGAGASTLAEQGAEGLLARATGGAITRGADSFAARTIARATGMAASGAVSGAEIGLQQTLSEAALHEDGNADLTGEKIVAGMGHGAFVGAIAGFGTGVAAEGISTGVKAAAKSIPGRLERAANREMWRDLNSSKKISKQVLARVPGGVEAIGATARAEELDSLSLSVEEQWSKAAEAQDRVAGEIQDLYRQSGASGKPKDLLEKLDGIIREVNEKPGFENTVGQLQSYRDSLAQRLFKGLQPGETFMTPQEEQLAAFEKELLANGAPKHRLDEIRQIRDALAGARGADAREAGLRALEEHEIPLTDLWKYRKDLDQILRWDGSDPQLGSKVDELRRFRGMFSDYMLQAGERSSEGFADRLKDLNGQYQRLSVINDTLEEKVARELTNRRASLTDSIAHAGGTGAAATLAMAGHWLPAALALASGAANKLVREKGPRLAAFIMGRVGGLEDVAAHIGEVDANVERAVTAFADHPYRDAALPSAIPEVKAERALAREDDQTVEDRFLLKSAALKNAAEHPELAENIDKRLASVAQHAPDAAKAAAGTAKRALTYLAAQLPPQMPLDPLRPGELAPPPLAAMDRWLRQERAIDDPGAAFHDLARGHLDAVALQAVKEVYPTLASRFQQAVLSQIAGKGRDLGQQERLQLATALDTPTTPSLTQEGMAARQATFAQQGAAGGDSGGKPMGRRRGGGKLSDAWPLATTSQQIEKGD